MVKEVVNELPSGSKEMVVEFVSLNEFYEYIMNTPTNISFARASCKSRRYGKRAKDWTKTTSFEEAAYLLKNGWTDMSGALTQSLRLEESKMEPFLVQKNVLGIQGFHPIVPLYLMGIPNNMVRKEMHSVKQKVITLNKSITYAWHISSEQIIEQSLKSLMLIKKLEAQHYRCNLNIVFGVNASNFTFLVKVRIKSANEKLNVSKLSFPLVHPSMLRRLMLRFIEVHPKTPIGYTFGYGTPISVNTIKSLLEGEYFLPPIIVKDVREVRNLDDLEKIDRLW